MNDIERVDYRAPGLHRADLDPDPLTQFGLWLTAAADVVREPNAMALATVNRNGTPSVRFVLLKGVVDGQFVFFTNYQSTKGRELAGNPQAALAFHWQPQYRQVRVVGSVIRLPGAVSEEYFASRPRGAQIGAWASAQSRVIGTRESLIEDYEAAEQRFPDEVPRPEHWGGFALSPIEIEFWQGQPSRLHDRVRYRLVDDAWRMDRLAP